MIVGMTEEISGYKAVKRLAVERPDWLPIVRECLDFWKKHRADFAGAWIYQRMQEMGGPKFSKLTSKRRFWDFEKGRNFAWRSSSLLLYIRS